MDNKEYENMSKEDLIKHLKHCEEVLANIKLEKDHLQIVLKKVYDTVLPYIN